MAAAKCEFLRPSDVGSPFRVGRDWGTPGFYGFRGLGLRVYKLQSFGLWGLAVWGLGFRPGVLGFGVRGLEFRVKDVDFLGWQVLRVLGWQK